MLEYLSRYSHRTAICNKRIRLINGSQVVFTVRGDGRVRQGVSIHARHHSQVVFTVRGDGQGR